jgi:hypothetical protein
VGCFLLKIDPINGKLLRLTDQSLSQSGITERSDLQELIFQNADEFFHDECGEDLFVIEAEMEPSTLVADRIDLLAIDVEGKTVIIELKRGSHKLQLLQAVSYAAMVADLEWKYIASRVDASRRDALGAFLLENELDQEEMNLNSAQRIVLIAESYDYEVLRTAEWLTEHGINITCYEVALARDQDNGTDYLSAVQLFPPKPLAAQARLRGALRNQEENQPRTLEMKLESCTNPAIKEFFQRCLMAKPRRNRRRDALVFPLVGKMRFRFTARRDYANVAQLGRFEGDEQRWSVLSASKLKAEAKRLRFRLYTERDIQAFEQLLKQDYPKIIWTAGLSTGEEEDEDENGD